MTTQLEILRSDLEAERAKNDELCQELNCVQSDLYKERRKIETVSVIGIVVEVGGRVSP